MIANREISIKDKGLIIKAKVETVYEKTIKPFGNLGKICVSKKYLESKVYVIVLED